MESVLRRLRRMLAPRRSRQPDLSRALFIDDDVVDGIEVLPESAAAWCAGQLAEIAAFSERHRTPGGTGWSDLHVRPSAPAGIAGLAIPLAPAVAALDRQLPRFERVITGSLDNPRPIPRAHGFGTSPLSAIALFEWKASGTVERLDLILRGPAAEQGRVLAALAALPSPEPLLVVHWPTARLARLADPAEVERYLQSKPG